MNFTFWWTSKFIIDTPPIIDKCLFVPTLVCSGVLTLHKNPTDDGCIYRGVVKLDAEEPYILGMSTLLSYDILCK